MNKFHLHFTSASIVAIIGAVIAVAVSFGLHLTQANINSIMTLVGLLGAALTIGGGVKTAGLIRAGFVRPGQGAAFHFTGATIVALVGSVISLAVSFGLHLTQANIDSIMKLVGLIAAGLVVGGAVKSQALLNQGFHPLQLAGGALQQPGVGPDTLGSTEKISHSTSRKPPR